MTWAGGYTFTTLFGIDLSQFNICKQSVQKEKYEVVKPISGIWFITMVFLCIRYTLAHLFTLYVESKWWITWKQVSILPSIPYYCLVHLSSICSRVCWSAGRQIVICSEQDDLGRRMSRGCCQYRSVVLECQWSTYKSLVLEIWRSKVQNNQCEDHQAAECQLISRTPGSVRVA